MTVTHADSHRGSGLLRRIKGLVSREPENALVLTEEQAWDLYDSQARELLGMSAEEFERAWNRGEFRARQEETSVRRLIMIRAARPSSR